MYLEQSVIRIAPRLKEESRAPTRIPPRSAGVFAAAERWNADEKPRPTPRPTTAPKLNKMNSANLTHLFPSFKCYLKITWVREIWIVL